MKTFFKLILLAGFALLMLLLVGGVALWQTFAHEIAHAVGSGLSVNINGEDLDVQGSLQQALGGISGLALASLGACVAMGFALLFVFGLPLLILGCVLAALLTALFSVGAVICSPLVLFVLLMIVLLRKKPRGPSRSNRPNITP